jgi:hypothetical protein
MRKLITVALLSALATQSHARGASIATQPEKCSSSAAVAPNNSSSSAAVAPNKSDRVGADTANSVSKNLSSPIRVQGDAVPEGNSGTSTLNFQISQQGLTAPVTLNYSTQAGSAGNSDFVATQGQVQLTPAQPIAIVAVQISGDAEQESDETLRLQVIDPNSLIALPPAVGGGIILNDDGLTHPSGAPFRIANAAVREGNSGTSELRFLVQRTDSSPASLQLNYQTQDNTALAGDDYVAANGSVTLSTASPYAIIAVNVLGDGAVEPNEDMRLLVSAAGASSPSQQALGLIVNDDGVSVQPPEALILLPFDAQAIEPASGQSEARLGLRLNRVAAEAITVNFLTAPGATATAGADYLGPGTGSVTFAPGETLKQITYQVLADTLSEGREFFHVQLSTASAVGLPRAIAQLSILDRVTGTPSVPNSAVIIPCRPFVREDAGLTRLVVKRIGSTDAALNVSFRTIDGSALAGSDYIDTIGSLNWSAGNAELKRIEVPILDDAPAEQPEDFRVELHTNTGVLPHPGSQARVQILDSVESFQRDDFGALCTSEAEADGQIEQR